MDTTTVFPAELYERILASVLPEQLPRVEKTGITLSQAYRQKAAILEWEISAVLALPLSTGDKTAMLDVKQALAHQYRTNSQILDSVGSEAPQWRSVKGTTTASMLLEVDGQMFDLFVDTHGRDLYIRMNDEIGFVLFDRPGRVWIKYPSSVAWKRLVI